MTCTVVSWTAFPLSIKSFCFLFTEKKDLMVLLLLVDNKIIKQEVNGKIFWIKIKQSCAPDQIYVHHYYLVVGFNAV